jgi:hypothetical protein
MVYIKVLPISRFCVNTIVLVYIALLPDTAREVARDRTVEHDTAMAALERRLKQQRDQRMAIDRCVNRLVLEARRLVVSRSKKDSGKEALGLLPPT